MCIRDSCCIIPFLVIGSLVFCPVFVDAGRFFPGLDQVGGLFPPWYYLQAVSYTHLDVYKRQVILTSHELAELALCTKMYILKGGVLSGIDCGLSAKELISQFR